MKAPPGHLEELLLWFAIFVPPAASSWWNQQWWAQNALPSGAMQHLRP